MDKLNAFSHRKMQDFSIAVNLTGVLDESSRDEDPVHPSPAVTLPRDGSEWVDLFVMEMMNASNVDDARARASRALEVLEKSIMSRVDAEAMQNFQKVF